MLPFLKNKNERGSSGVIVHERAPDEKPESDQDDSSAAIESAAAALIDAVHAKDVQAVAAAMKDAFDILESMPHEEAESDGPSPHSYDAQNAAAAERD